MTTPAIPTPQDSRWTSVLTRERAADGTFIYAVRTTGVYCRPSCGARTPRPENVSFYATCEAAEAAGFRACKRCKPGQASAADHEAIATAACRLIEAAESPPSLEELAAHVGVSPSHFHRVFKQVTGLTPRAYAAAHRERRVREELSGGAGVTDAIFEAGYNSSGRFYDQSKEVLGMTPTRYRSGGADTTIRFAVGDCSLGAILVAATDVGLCAILMGDDPEALVRDLQDRFPKAEMLGGEAEFERTVAQVIGFVDAPGHGLTLPLDVRGTAFQQRVWQALREIPPGRTVSYTELAERIGSPRSVRAVAQACGANALAVAIPCHRVVRHDGGLSGYRWGVERKRALLDKEARA